MGMVQQLLSVDTEQLPLLDPQSITDIVVLVTLVSDTLAMVMLLLLSPMLPQLSLMATLLLLLPLLPMEMLPLLKVLLLLSVDTELLLLLDLLSLMDRLPAVAMLLILSELSIMPKEKLMLSLKPMLMPSMHLMDTAVLDTLDMVTTGLDMGLDTEVLVILVLDTPDHMVLDMDILTTAKLCKRSSMANLKIIFPHCNVNHLFTETIIIKF